MTDNSHRTLERIARRVPVPEPAYDRLLRRRDRKERNRRLSAAVLAIVLTLLSITGLMRAFGNSERPATEPTPTPVDTGIFSGMGGWIAYGVYYGYYGDRRYGGTGIWAMDPERPGIHKQLSTHPGEPLAWSSDGSKLLILRQTGQGSAADQALYVLNADGSETLLIDAGCTPPASQAGRSRPTGRRSSTGTCSRTGATPGSTWSMRLAAHRGDFSRVVDSRPTGPGFARCSRRLRSPPTGLRSRTSTAGAITTTASG